MKLSRKGEYALRSLINLGIAAEVGRSLVQGSEFADNEQLPEGPGKSIVVKVCTTCHDLSVLPSLKNTKDQWQDIVDAMRGMGAEGTDEDFNAIVTYLAKNFGAKEDPRVNINKAAADEIATVLALSAKEAGSIIDYRKQHGDFKDWNDLIKVEGVDAGKLEAVKNRIEY